MKDKKNKISDFVSKVEDGTNEAFDRINDPLMDEDAAEADSSNINYSDIVKTSPEDKRKKLPWIVAIVLIILIVLSFCALFFQSNPKTIFVKAVDGLFNGVTSKLGDSAYDVVNGNLDLEYKVHSDIDDSSLDDEISKIKWQAKYNLDVTNDRAFAKITGNNGNDEIKLDVYSEKDDKYIKLDSFENYLKIGQGHFSLNILNSFGDVSTLFEGVNQAFDKAVASEKIIGGNKTINLNGEEMKVYESKLVVNDSNKERFKETFINSMAANTSFIKALHNIRNTDIKDEVLNVQTSKDNLNKMIDEAGKIEISIYTKGKNQDFVQLNIKTDKGGFNLVKGSDGYNYSLTNDDEVISGTMDIKVNKNNHKFNISLEKKENDKVLYTQNIKIDLKTKNNGSFKNVDIGNFVEYANMSDVDKFNLQTNIVSNPVISKLVSAGLEVNLDELFK